VGATRGQPQMLSIPMPVRNCRETVNGWREQWRLSRHMNPNLDLAVIDWLIDSSPLRWQGLPSFLSSEWLVLGTSKHVSVLMVTSGREIILSDNNSDMKPDVEHYAEHDEPGRVLFLHLLRLLDRPTQLKRLLSQLPRRKHPSTLQPPPNLLLQLLQWLSKETPVRCENRSEQPPRC